MDIVIAGAGEKAFVSGSDISQFDKNRDTAEQQAEYDRVSAEVQKRYASLSKPLIAMIQGYCLGGACALAVAWPRGPAVVVEGRIEGAVTFPPRGTLGFGYDPIFVPEGGDLTFGELPPAEKDAISHRARAFAQLKAALFD